MTQFSSRGPFINVDPKPYVTYADHRRTDVRSEEWDMQSDGGVEYVRVYEPRPEYNRPQNNPSNPVLLWARESGVEHALDELELFVRSEPQVRVAHVLHARRVLTRLANLSKGTP